MSGICGMVGPCARVEASILGRMLAVLEARGPDGMAVERDERAPMALGLSFLRTTPAEPEPAVLTSADGTLCLVCDGQVFNRAELMDRLRNKYPLPPDAPAGAILLHLFEDEGPAGWRRVDGQFALALWDRRAGVLRLARDGLGVCPLYYCATADGVVFASEVKALLQHPQVPCTLDEIGTAHYLTFLNVPGPRTLFAGVSRLMPGTVATAAADGTVRRERFWDLLDDPVPEADDEEFYVRRVRELHVEAVARRRTGDGPLAALLSGGNDSSANAAYLARQTDRPLHTITVGLAAVEGQDKYNDLLYARQVADLIGSKHHELLLSTDEFLQTIPATIDALDDLVSEPSSIFLHHALRLAREQGARVVITGEANDELSCGHGEMIRLRDGYYRRWLPWVQKPRWLRRVAAVAAPLLAPRRRDILRRAAADADYFWNFEIAWTETEEADILDAALWRRCRAEGPATVVARHAGRLRATEHGRRDYLNHIIYLMMQDYYFGNLMLGKLNLLAARLGVEARCPYTAPAYAHFVFNIPARFKFRDGLVKAFFKKALAGVLPDDIIYRPKQGFRTPVVELFQGALGDWARPVLLDGGLTGAGLLRRDHLDRLLQDHRRGERDHSNKLWTALMLNLWYERWVRTRPAEAIPRCPPGL